jgi:putative transposase
MTPTHGRSPRGARLVDRVPHGRWRTLTFLAALRCDRLTAPCVFDGPINGSSFQAYVAQFLVPTLKPGDIVVLDNLGSHKCQAVRRTIRAAGAKLFFFPSPIRSSRLGRRGGRPPPPAMGCRPPHQPSVDSSHVKSNFGAL